MDPIVDSGMRSYYDRRAAEYDDWWLGSGLFAARERPGWSDEVVRLCHTVAGLAPARVLDVACGTGFLTRHLRGTVVAIDQSPGMVDVAARRLPAAEVRVGEAVPLPFAGGSFGRVFTGHFYGHLRPGERDRFVAEAKRVAAELVVVDSALHDGVRPEEEQQRVLGDGSSHRVFKRYFTGPRLAAELGGGRILHQGRWFVAVQVSWH
jgi:SAM-dependent methyltransferase